MARLAPPQPTHWRTLSVLIIVLFTKLTVGASTYIVDVGVGESIRLNCTAQQNVTFYWRKKVEDSVTDIAHGEMNSLTLESPYDETQFSFIRGNASNKSYFHFQLSRIKISDAGNYSCFVIDELTGNQALMQIYDVRVRGNDCICTAAHNITCNIKELQGEFMISRVSFNGTAIHGVVRYNTSAILPYDDRLQRAIFNSDIRIVFTINANSTLVNVTCAIPVQPNVSLPHPGLSTAPYGADNQSGDVSDGTPPALPQTDGLDTTLSLETSLNNTLTDDSTLSINITDGSSMTHSESSSTAVPEYEHTTENASASTSSFNHTVRMSSNGPTTYRNDTITTLEYQTDYMTTFKNTEASTKHTERRSSNDPTTHQTEADTATEYYANYKTDRNLTEPTTEDGLDNVAIINISETTFQSPRSHPEDHNVARTTTEYDSNHVTGLNKEETVIMYYVIVPCCLVGVVFILTPIIVIFRRRGTCRRRPGKVVLHSSLTATEYKMPSIHASLPDFTFLPLTTMTTMSVIPAATGEDGTADTHNHDFIPDVIEASIAVPKQFQDTDKEMATTSATTPTTTDDADLSDTEFVANILYESSDDFLKSSVPNPIASDDATYATADEVITNGGTLENFPAPPSQTVLNLSTGSLGTHSGKGYQDIDSCSNGGLGCSPFDLPSPRLKSFRSEGDVMHSSEYGEMVIAGATDVSGSWRSLVDIAPYYATVGEKRNNTMV